MKTLLNIPLEQIDRHKMTLVVSRLNKVFPLLTERQIKAALIMYGVEMVYSGRENEVTAFIDDLYGGEYE